MKRFRVEQLVVLPREMNEYDPERDHFQKEK